ncbi:MAG: outer membrane beta-barrel protein [Aquificae bacterium]|nr:outer membrane beta-barrel protein [Aquificota bacterium]
MKKVVGLATAVLSATAVANAGNLIVANSDIEMSGGVSAGYFYTSNNDRNNEDYFTVSTFAIDLTTKANETIGFTVGFGTTKHPALLEPNPEASFEVEYGWVSIRPMENLTIDAGKLLTNVGYELFHTYENQNYTYGLVWYGQPLNYAGLRATYSVAENLDVYVEYSHDTAGSVSVVNPSDAFAVGYMGSAYGIDYAVSYFDYNKTKNLIDVVFSTEYEGISIGLNFDYQWMDDTAKEELANQGAAKIDDSAYGIALYLSTKVDVFELPVRLEYVNDGSATKTDGTVVCEGIYGVAGDDAWSFTITPTYRPADNTYVRVEFAYVSTDGKGFTDDKGNEKDSRTFIGLEAGFIF